MFPLLNIRYKPMCFHVPDRFSKPCLPLISFTLVMFLKGTKVRRNMRLPTHGSNVELPDEVAFYGYRPCHVDLFFLSPWEFTQWFKPERLRVPSIDYKWSKWTKDGKDKVKAAPGQKIRFVPYEDYILNLQTIKENSQIHVYPPSQVLFSGAAPQKYERFRHSWLLIRRQRPVIPCPQQTPLPSKRMNKSTRAKIFSVYLRPWTLSKEIATAVVPYLGDLDQMTVLRADATAALPGASAITDANIRRSWKQYVASPLPHAGRQLKNFQLACMAEGRRHDDEEEGAHRRGATLTCPLTKDDIAEIMAGHRRHEVTQDETTRSAKDDPKRSAVNPMAAKMAATTALAMQLAEKCVRTPNAHTDQAKSLLAHCKAKPEAKKSAADVDMNDSSDATVGITTHNWRKAYVSWRTATYDRVATSGKVPNAKQSEVLELIHRRCVFETGGENDQNEPPLLRLLHGLPGSGKSQLLIWVRAYFQEVWLWVEGREFSFLAPLNSMASNIGGSTVHSWGGISFKDKRGVRILGVPQVMRYTAYRVIVS
jgi:hypothetical protein